MNHSDSITDLAAAFAAFQGEAKNPVKSQEVDTGKFRYSFAPLDEIIAGVRPLLAKHGLAIAQELITDNEGQIGCGTLIMHESGQWLAFSPFFVPGGADAPAHGSAASYARRYSLLAALNLSAGQDEDAAPPASPRAQKPRSAPRRSSPSGEVMITERQTAKIAAEAAATGVTDAQLAKAMKRYYKVETTGELTRDQASDLIALLVKKHKEQDGDDPPADVDPDYEAARADDDEAPGMDSEQYAARREALAGPSDGAIF